MRTSAGQLWENNPYLTPIADGDPEAEVVPMRYDLIHQSNEGAYHFIHGYARHLEEVLGVRVPVTRQFLISSRRLGDCADCRCHPS